MKNQKGKFIVFYGLNNLGKTTQAELLIDNLRKNGFKAKYVKYPNYDIMPTGKIINNYLREGNKYNLSPREVQILYAFNREQYEKKIKKYLRNGIHVISECYIGTGLAWGEAHNVDSEFLRHINSHLIKEDLAFYFRGKRFTKSIEKHHVHENNNELVKKAQIAFELMSKEFGWVDIYANQDIMEIEKQIFDYVLEYISNSQNLKFSSDFSSIKSKQVPSTNSGRTNKKNVSVKKLSPLAKIPDSSDRYTYNLYSHGYYTIHPGKIEQIHTGIKLFLKHNFIAIITNDLGHFSCALNSKFTKEVKINFYNSSDDVIVIKPGQRVGHVVFQKLNDPLK